MKRLIAMGVVLLMAMPAHAVRVTNLDSKTHVVELVYAGTTEKQTVAPDETAYFPVSGDGMLSLISVPPQKPDEALNADGILRGIIGAVRTHDIPTIPFGRYVIWPGGELMLQHNQERNGDL